MACICLYTDSCSSERDSSSASAVAATVVVVDVVVVVVVVYSRLCNPRPIGTVRRVEEEERRDVRKSACCRTRSVSRESELQAAARRRHACAPSCTSALTLLRDRALLYTESRKQLAAAAAADACANI
ncbi:unnamed protein product [Trichogramma brassicae]|uniref:Uncharacterized protein n=1 Tax=Trichogramma brassicae TaxID=86971 RepID=A0A6H5J552_9HYME|nr:unnamed protein product [Trichogramma brassicae]